jgi:hypothetical protein
MSGQPHTTALLVAAGAVSGQLLPGFNPPAGASFQVITAGLAETPLFIDRDAGNGYVFNFFGGDGALTLVARPGRFTLPPTLSLLPVRPDIRSLRVPDPVGRGLRSRNRG